MSTEGATILFTDMVGSTALASALAPDAADEATPGAFLDPAPGGRRDGWHRGEEPRRRLMVAFTSTSAALSCAVAMQQGVERDNRDREHSVGLRVGLSAGEVTREDDDYFGDPVVEAARLCATCESGQILATDVVRAMAGRRNRHQCRPARGTDPEGSARSCRDG